MTSNKWLYKLVTITSFIPLVALPLLTTSCSVDQFERYVNIDDVLAQKNGWRQTLYSQFGNSSPNSFPANWDFRQTTDIDQGKCYQRHCGDKNFIWTKDNVDNSQDGYLKINYQQGATYTDPADPSFTTNNFSGSISTENQFQQAFGYWEVDAKFLDRNYGWAAFWLQCQSQGQMGNGGRDGSEIDIFESFWWARKNTIQLSIWADGYSNKMKGYVKVRQYWKNNQPVNVYDDFHKFGFLWTPTNYYMFVDHELIFSTDAIWCNNTHPPLDYGMGICQVPCFAILSGHLGPNNPGQTDSKAPTGLPFGEYDGVGKFLVKNFVCYQNENFEPYIKSPTEFTSPKY